MSLKLSTVSGYSGVTKPSHAMLKPSNVTTKPAMTTIKPTTQGPKTTTSILKTASSIKPVVKPSTMQKPIGITQKPFNSTKISTKPTSVLKPSSVPAKTTPTSIKPTNAPVKLTQAPVKPTQISAKPSQISVKPTQSLSKPTQFPTKPTQFSAKPSQVPMKPSAPTKPTFSPSKPILSPTKLTNITSKPTIAPTKLTNTPVKSTFVPSKASMPPIKPTIATIKSNVTIKPLANATKISPPNPTSSVKSSTSKPTHIASPTKPIKTSAPPLITTESIRNVNRESTTERLSSTIPSKATATYKPSSTASTTFKNPASSNLLHNSSSTLISSIKINSHHTPTIHTQTISSNVSVTNVSEPYRKTEESWKLVATVSPPTHTPTTKPKTPKPTEFPSLDYYQQTPKIDLSMQGNFGMPNLSEDMQMFTKVYNELALKLWGSLSIDQISPERSVIFSPFGKISLLAMIFLGARGATSGEMNDLLKLDDIVMFNPHLKFKEVTESITTRQAASAIVRELYSDNTKGKILDFYKERVRNFYDGHVEEVDFKIIKDVIKRRTNMMIKKQTRGYMQQYLGETNFKLKGPLAALSMNIFQVVQLTPK